MGIAAEYVTKNGRLKLRYDADNIKVLFRFLSSVKEVFEEEACGACGSKEIRFDYRENDGNSFYKMTCDACHHQMDFGQNKTGGGMFARRDKGKNGWYDWKAERGASADSRANPATAPSSTTTKAPPGPPTDDVPF